MPPVLDVALRELPGRGSEEVLEDHLDRNYATLCDPRLNARQSLDLAFRVAELMRAAEERGAPHLP